MFYYSSEKYFVFYIFRVNVVMEINATRKWDSFSEKQIKKMKSDKSVFIHCGSMYCKIVNYNVSNII